MAQVINFLPLSNWRTGTPDVINTSPRAGIRQRFRSTVVSVRSRTLELTMIPGRRLPTQLEVSQISGCAIDLYTIGLGWVRHSFGAKMEAHGLISRPRMNILNISISADA